MQNQSSWNGFPAFAAMVGEFSGKLQELEDLCYQQGNVLPGVTVAKNTLRKQTTENARVIIGALKAYALVTGDAELSARADLTQSDLHRMPHLVFKQQLDAILQLANEHLTELADFGIDQLKVDALQTLRDECDLVFNSPRQAIIDRKTLTESIRQRVKAMDRMLKKGLDALMISFKESVPDFYFHYKSARIIIDAKGKSRTGNGSPADEGQDGD